MSVATRAAALIAAFLIVVGAGVFVVVYYIGSATTQLPIVHYTASGGQVSVALQEDPAERQRQQAGLGEATTPRTR